MRTFKASSARIVALASIDDAALFQTHEGDVIVTLRIIFKAIKTFEAKISSESAPMSSIVVFACTPFVRRKAVMLSDDLRSL